MGHQKRQSIQVPEPNEKAAYQPSRNQFGRGFQAAQEAFQELISGVRVQMANTLENLPVGTWPPDSGELMNGNPFSLGYPMSLGATHATNQHPTNKGHGTT